jgi:hypothetical protein
VLSTAAGASAFTAQGSVNQVYVSGLGPNAPLPIVPGVSAPTGTPACPSLRNEPCRSYQAFANNGS